MVQLLPETHTMTSPSRQGGGGDDNDDVGHVPSGGSNTNIGASMMLVQRHRPGNHCCCVSIYVNNNIQGVTNSVLLGSKVTMEDAGLRLSLTESSPDDDADDGLRKEMMRLVVLTRILLFISSSGLLGLLLVFCILSWKST